MRPRSKVCRPSSKNVPRAGNKNETANPPPPTLRRTSRRRGEFLSRAQRALECGGLTPLSASTHQRYNHSCDIYFGRVGGDIRWRAGGRRIAANHGRGITGGGDSWRNQLFWKSKIHWRASQNAGVGSFCSA